MSYTMKTLLANRCNYGGSRTSAHIKYIVLHYTANDGDHAEGNAKYFHNNVVKSSAHYFVDDDSVTQSVPDLCIAWAVGGRKYTDCASTGGGSMYGKITNANSISIELCDTLRDGQYQATEATMANAAALCRKLMDRYGIPVSRVFRHFDVTGKHCPAYLMDSGKWTAFKDRLTESPVDSATKAAIQSLVKAGVLSSAEYWAKHAGDVKYLPDLLQKAAKKIKRAGPPAATVGGALDRLRVAGVISASEYWTKHAGDIKYLGDLIRKLGGSV